MLQNRPNVLFAQVVVYLLAQAVRMINVPAETIVLCACNLFLDVWCNTGEERCLAQCLETTLTTVECVPAVSKWTEPLMKYRNTKLFDVSITLVL